MSDEQSLAFATIEELAALLAKRKISPVELTEIFLRRIERHNPALNAFLTVTAEHALAAARRAEKQLLRGRSARSGNSPLLGIPITLKDNIWTRGIRTTAGSKILQISSRRKIPPWRESSPARAPFCSARRTCTSLRTGLQAATRTTARRTIPGRSIEFPEDRVAAPPRDCRGPVRGFRRHRHGWIDPRSFRAVRDCRTEADLRTRQRIRHGAARAVVRSHWPAGAQRHGRGNPARPARRARSAGPDFIAASRGRFPWRASQAASEISPGPPARTLLGEARSRSAPRDRSGGSRHGKARRGCA